MTRVGNLESFMSIPDHSAAPSPTYFRMACAQTLKGLSVAAFGTALVSTGALHAASARTIVSTGTLNPVTTVTVGSQVSGVVQDVLCDFNSVVKKGQVCARIDQRPFQRAVDQARANLANAKALLEQHQASLAYLKASLDRNTTLAQRGVVSKDAFESVQSNYGQAMAQIDVDKAVIAQRQAELGIAELNLGYTNIESPIDGVVLSRVVSPGATLAASFQAPTLFVIASDLTKLQLIANVTEADIGTIKPGDQATFTVKAFGDRGFKCSVAQVRNAPEAGRSDVSYAVVLEVDNADRILKPGMTASIRLVTADK